MRKIRIGVLMGGMSAEREVSLNSGRTICDHLDTYRYAVVPLFQDSAGLLYLLPDRFVHRGKTTDFEGRLAQEALILTWDGLKEYVDFVYIALHGRFGEDGSVQGMLELLGIPYFGSKVFASALGMRKDAQKYVLQQAGIKVPRWYVIDKATIEHIADTQYVLDTVLDNLQKLTYPLIIKPCAEGSSLGVSIVHAATDVYGALMQAAYVQKDMRPSDVIAEEMIRGMEFSCIVVTDALASAPMPLVPTEIVPEGGLFDYDQKYMPGRSHKYTPARCSLEQQWLIQQMCVKTMQALGMTNMARIDGFLTIDNEVYIMDPNSFSGMAPSSFAFLQAAESLNMSHTQFINHLIETDLRSCGLMVDIEQSNEEVRMQAKQKIRIAILMGGPSAEREISLESGRNVVYKLSPQKYEVIPLFVDVNAHMYRIDQRLLVRNTTAEIAQHLCVDNRVLWNDLPGIADFVFIALHGGIGENGSVQGALELLRMPYNGSSVFTSALCMDKYKTAQFLRAAGFEVPRHTLINSASWTVQQMHEWMKTAHVAFPLIVKPHDDGCSVLVEKVHTNDELVKAIDAIFVCGRTQALIEEYIQGTELTVGVIGNAVVQALPPSQVVARAGVLSIYEKFLPGAGENRTPACLPDVALAVVQKTMETAYKTIQASGYVRIDCFYQDAGQSPTGKERVIILEVNTLPALTPATCLFHQAAEIGMKPMDFIDTLVALGFEQHRRSEIAAPVLLNERKRDCPAPVDR